MQVFEFGARVKELREGKNLTQKEAAHLIGVSRTSIIGYETGEKSPKLSTLVRMARVYNSSVDYILGVDTRKCIYLDGFSENQQDIIIEFIGKLESEMKK